MGVLGWSHLDAGVLFKYTSRPLRSATLLEVKTMDNKTLAKETISIVGKGNNCQLVLFILILQIVF